MGHILQDMDLMVKTSLAIEREVDDAWSIWDLSASDKRKGDPLLLALERSRGLLLHSGFRDRATAIRAKARINHCKVRDTSRLPVS